MGSSNRNYLACAVSPAAISQPPPLGEQGCVMSMDTSPVIRNTNASAVVPSWDNSIAQPLSASRTQGMFTYYAHKPLSKINEKNPTNAIDELYLAGTGAVATNNCSSSIESPSTTWPTSEAVEQENMLRPLRGEFPLFSIRFADLSWQMHVDQQLSLYVGPTVLELS